MIERTVGDEEICVRRRGENRSYLYFKTGKCGKGIKRIEEEERIDEATYFELLKESDPAFRPIEKTRYLYAYQGQYFEIDLYPTMKDEATVEIELCREDTPVHLPDYFTLIREVTNDPAYKNKNLAKL